jgi:hypothetical protein
MALDLDLSALVEASDEVTNSVRSDEQTDVARTQLDPYRAARERAVANRATARV